MKNNKWEQLKNHVKKEIKSNNEISIDINQIKSREKQNWIMLAIISMLCVISGYMGFSGGFRLEASPIIVVLVAGIYSFTIQWSLEKNKRAKFGIPAICGTILLYIIITMQSFINGYTGIINQIITTINETMAEAHVKFVVSEKNLVIDKMIATVAICAIITVAFNLLLRYRRIFLCAFIVLGGTMINMIYKGEGQTLWVALSLICALEIFYFSNVRISKTKKSYTAGNVLAVVLTVISITFILFFNYSGIRSVDDLKEAIIYHGGNLVYGKSDYPEGQFKRFDQLTQGDEDVRLRVTMSTPISMHMKGYVGCQYTDKGWKGNDEKIYGGDYTGMIDWFMQQGYYPLSQAAYYMEYSVKNGLDPDTIDECSVHVENNSASRKYEYVPESLLDMSQLISPKQDVNFVEQDLFGEKEYWYEMVSYRDEDYLKFPSQNWFNDGTAEKEFVDAESIYHSFATTFYLDVPEEEKSILQANVPICSNNVSDAISTIRTYLKNQIEYSEECNAFNPDKNYLSQILLEDKRGYSVHYSTVATLMFRYYGIPARYVEGYYMANEEGKEVVELMDTNAHAWVEIYIKGFGFVPIEVTPGYYQEDNIGGGSSKNMDDSSSGGGGGSSGTQKDKELNIIEINWVAILIWALTVIIVLIILFIIALVIRRFIILSKRKKDLASDNPYKVVDVAGTCMEKACTFAKLSIIDEISREVCQILEKIKFSNHMLRKEEADKVVECMHGVIDKIWNAQSFIKKIKMMFWNCLK